MGQKDTIRAAINFQYTDLNDTIPGSSLAHSTFKLSKGICFYTKLAKNITVVENIFTECEKYGVAVFDKTNHVTVNGNLFTGIKMRATIRLAGSYDYTAALSTETTNDNMQLEVRDNIAQGVEGIGYLVTGVKCEDQAR